MSAETNERGSAEVITHSCDTCSDAKTSEAVEYCKPCQQYLCSLCCQHHKKATFTTHHKTTDIEELKNIKTEKSLWTRQIAPWAVIKDISKLNDGLKDPRFLYERHICRDMQYVEKNQNLIFLITKLFLINNEFSKLYIMNEGDLIKALDFNVSYSSILLKSTNQDVLFCCAPNIQKVHKIDLTSDDGNPETVFKTNGDCTAIAEFNDGFAVLLSIETGYLSMPKWQIQFVDYEGRIKQQLCFNSEDKPLVDDPQCMITNVEKTILYIAERLRNKVVALDTNGDVISNIKIDHPTGLAVDNEKNLYVAGISGITQVCEIGSESRLLLQKRYEKSYSFIVKVCFNSKFKHLVVVDSSSVMVNIFSFLG